MIDGNVILEHSETFWSVLTTLVVFCMLPNNSNFIYKMLENVLCKIKIQLGSLRDNVKLDRIEKSLEFKMVKSFASKGKADAIKLITEVAIERSSVQFNYVEHYGGQMDKLFRFNEQNLAPLYSFLLCLMVFVCNIILRNEIIDITLMSSCLFMFTIFSFCFWIIGWIVFVLNSLRIKEPNQKCKFESIKNKIDKIGWFKGFLIKIFIYLILLGLIGLFKDILSGWCLLLCIVTPICIVGILRISCCNSKGDYSPLLILGHFVAFVALSIISVLFLQFFEIDIFYMSNVTYVKILLFLFVILNGFVFPFVIPLGCLNELHKRAKKYNIESQKATKEKVKEIEDKLRSFCEQNISEII